MKKTLALLTIGIQGNAKITDEFRGFFLIFKHEFEYELYKLGCKKVEIYEGHYYVSGFFTAPNGRIFYFSMPVATFNVNSDGHFGSLLYRTAKDYHDFDGGKNNYIKLTNIQNMNLTGEKIMFQIID